MIEDIPGTITALFTAAREFGVGFWSVGTLFLLIVLAFKLPGIIKAISTFITEYRTTTASIDAQKKRLDLEIERKMSKFRPRQQKETRK